MTHFITIDELEKEIVYLREQNQKLLRELSQVVKENTVLREELGLERRRLHKILDDAGKELWKKNKDNRLPGRGEEDPFCLN